MTTKVEIAVLGLLAEQPMHGYDLLERAGARSMGFWTELSRASVYQVLKRLERDGLVAGRAQGGREGPDRRVFRITKAGRARLAEGAVETAGALAPVESRAGVALGVAHSLPASAARAAADGRERSLRDLLDGVRTELDRTRDLRDPGRAVSTAMLELQASLAEAELAWLKAFRAASGKARR
jgi:DNA-binding PadR family transcriptional regulator